MGAAPGHQGRLWHAEERFRRLSEEDFVQGFLIGRPAPLAQMARGRGGNSVRTSRET